MKIHLSRGAGVKSRVVPMLAVAPIVFIVLFVFGGAYAQTPFEAPKPGPEHKKLGVFIGSWITSGEVTENPFGPSEKWEGSFTWEWTPGNFGISRYFEGKGSVTGSNRGIEVIAFDNPGSTYTWYNADNMGGTAVAKASINGDILTAFWETSVKGKKYTIRGTLNGLGSDRTSWLSEYSEDGKTWKPYFRATDIRTKPNPSNENVEQILSRMEHDWVDATLKKDVAFVEGLLADGYVGIGADGRAVTRSEALEDFRTGAFSADSMRIYGLKVRIFGETAIVTYGQSEKSQYKGKDTSGQTMWTDIFVKKNGKWQLVANHASRVDVPK